MVFWTISECGLGLKSCSQCLRCIQTTEVAVDEERRQNPIYGDTTYLFSKFSANNRAWIFSLLHGHPCYNNIWPKYFNATKFKNRNSNTNSKEWSAQNFSLTNYKRQYFECSGFGGRGGKINVLFWIELYSAEVRLFTIYSFHNRHLSFCLYGNKYEVTTRVPRDQGRPRMSESLVIHDEVNFGTCLSMTEF